MELTSVNWVWFFSNIPVDFTKAYELVFDDPINYGLLVSYSLSIVPLEPFAQLFEVVASFWTHVLKQLNDHFWAIQSEVIMELQIHIRPSFRVIDAVYQ